jgi:hypothetical protein
MPPFKTEIDHQKFKYAGTTRDFVLVHLGASSQTSANPQSAVKSAKDLYFAAAPAQCRSAQAEVFWKSSTSSALTTFLLLVRGSRGLFCTPRFTARQMSQSSTAASSSSLAGKKRKLKIFYQPMHERNIHNVKLLISTVLPVTYEDSLFKRFLTYPEDFCKLGAFLARRNYQGAYRRLGCPISVELLFAF